MRRRKLFTLLPLTLTKWFKTATFTPKYLNTWHDFASAGRGAKLADLKPTTFHAEASDSNLPTVREFITPDQRLFDN
jgi:hypothetical protein